MIRILLIALVTIYCCQSLPVYAQKGHVLTISGRIDTEKAKVRDIDIWVIDVDGNKTDTIKKLKPIVGKHYSQGKYTLHLKPNRNYKIVFLGDTVFQDICYFNVHAKTSSPLVNRSYSIEGPYVDVWLLTNRNIKVADIVYDDNINRFKVIKATE
jgi:hypothetical protein